MEEGGGDDEEEEKEARPLGDGDKEGEGEEGGGARLMAQGQDGFWILDSGEIGSTQVIT